MTARRLRTVLVLAGIAAAALVLLAWTQAWFAVALTTGFRLDVAGDRAAPALTALAFAGLAAAAALTIAGRVLRVVLGGLQVAIGGAVAVLSALALADPVGAAASTVTEVTAVSGRESVTELVLAVTPTTFPYLAVIAGVAVAVVGLLVVLTASRWPGASRRYETDRDRSGTASGAWDALSGGEDPTR
ncbi:MAG TPA: Trp biosynthesis-associated membrane protein [Rhodoglobus sp.]|nr:Trp biosynthesis-associated membrane protein [Rhodoglobus sp.]